MEDSFRHKGLRKRLLNQLAEQGISDQRVLEAMYHIPRHFFLDKAFEEQAYENKAFRIEEQQTISQPFTVAFQTQLLEVKKREKILEIGTGSGYQSAVLAKLGARLYTIERHELLHQNAKVLFKHFDLGNIRSYFADGYLGLGEFAPFDKILITAAAPTIPESLKQQLRVGGYLVAPIGQDKQQEMIRLTKVSREGSKIDKFGQFCFVPMLNGKNPH